MNQRLLAILFLFCVSALHATNVSYTSDNTTDFPNPERGFYNHVEWHVTSGQSNLDADYFTAALAENRTLLLRLYYLDNYRSQNLPQSFLTEFSDDMALFRQYGCKAILRFAYDDDNDDGYQDGSLTWWKNHLDQLKPLMSANADVIYVVQAGFMGVWGEWYYSSLGTGDEIAQSSKNALLDKLLDCVPASRFVQVRTPNYKRAYTGYTAPMSSSDAYRNTKRGRVGHHNDAFLNKESNSGTYDDRTTDMSYLATECLYVPNGGENNVTSSSTYSSWATGAKAKAEMAQLHYSYLNAGYSEYTTNKWKTEGAFAEMSRNMGYRYQLVSATLPDSGAIGKVVNVQIQLRNVGYAPLYNERHAYIVFKNSSKTYSVQLSSDPRTWLPNGATTLIGENITLPSTMQAGTYQMYLYLPDASASIANNPKYAVRFANTGVWDSTTGYNHLNASIVVSSQGGDRPGPTPPTPSLCDEAVSLSTATQMTEEQGAATWTLSGNVLTVNYATTGSWGYTGVEFPLGSRTDLESVTFSYRGSSAASDWVALHAYLSDGESRYIDSLVDLSVHSDEGWSTVTIVPNKILWGDAASIQGTTITRLGFMTNSGVEVSSMFQLQDISLKYHCATTDLPDTAVAPSQEGKFLYNGHICIRHHNQCYDLMGHPIDIYTNY